MKKIKLLVTTGLITGMLLGCGTPFTCDICGEEKTRKAYTSEILGQKISMCQDCYDELQKEMKGLSEGLSGLTGK